MSSAGTTPAPLRPSVFLSYASEDRAAARALRDMLGAAGLDVWYDESELGGGDAWDQKIRRQIRDCDYFLPIISATTERRKEGYFRREWRLATERTLDMADDVLFLLPLSIDDTHESGARVPEKFLTVQWLRAPGGQRTAALDALIARLLAGEHTASPRPPLIARPAARASAPAAGPGAAPAGRPHALPPMPPFPHAPEKGGVGHWLKFLAEIAWWAITAAWLLLSRLPRWMRVVLSVWLVFTLVSTCGRNSTPKSKSKETPPPNSAEIERAVKSAAEQVAGVIEKSAKSQDWSRLGEEIGRRFGQPPIDPHTAGKHLVLVPFATGAADDAAARFATAVFDRCSERLGAARPDEVAIARVATEGTDAALTTLGRSSGVGFVLGARLTTSDGPPALAVRLVKISDGTLPWQASYPISGADAGEVAAKIAEAVSTHVPPRKVR